MSPARNQNIRSPQEWRSRPKKRAKIGSRKPIGQNKKSPSRKKGVPIKRRLVLICAIALLVFFIFASVAVAWISKDLPEPGGIIERDIPLSTKIYDRTGETLLYEFYSGEKRSPIKLSDLPKHAIWATIVAEDRNFYSHSGVKITSILRSIVVNTIKGGKVQGASTITQQLIKNAFLTTEKTYTRKIKEALLAYKLEDRFTKDQILELYFNEIPYGSTAYGIESAAQMYFGVSSKDLTIAQSAVLAALPKAPSRLSPYGTGKDELIARQKFIIDSMVSEGYISESDATKAKNEELEFKPLNSSIIAPHFVFYVQRLLAEKYGERTVEQGGLKITTTLDLFKQKIAQEIIDERGEINAKEFNASNASLVALDPKTGEILTMIGSRDFFDQDIDGEVNVATRPRQPGSSFKPIVYAAGFEQGLSPETVFFDLNTVFKTETGEDYEPKNYNLKENGPVNIRTALGSSLNIPAVKAIYLTGVGKVIDFAEKLGYTTLKDRSRFGLSLVLGGAEVTLLEHVTAYATFAREGIYNPPVAILKIEDKNGRVLEKFDKSKLSKEPVINPETVRKINSILSDNNARLLTFNENNYLTLGDRPVAAKTGTTNDYRDAWTLGYTPSLVVGVWVGNNDNSEMKGKAAGGTLAAPIWNMFMRRVLGDTPIETFNEPQKTKLPAKPLFNGKEFLERIVKIDKQTGKLATDYSPKADIIEKKFIEAHNILHYAKRGNLLGPIPSNPEEDPNYASWEESVQRWAKEKNIILGTPPMELDDLHTKQDEPFVSIENPKTVTRLETEVVVSARSPRGIRTIDYYLNNTLVKSESLKGEKKISKKTTKLKLPNTFSNGEHLLRVVVYDDIRNDAETSKKILVNIPNNPVTEDIVKFTSPENETSFSKREFPINIKVSIKKPESLKKISFYVQDLLTNGTELIASYTEIYPEMTIPINTSPEKGNYRVYAITTNSEGRLNLDSGINITIRK